MLELIAALLIIETSLLCIIPVYLKSINHYYNTKRSLYGLELLRGKLEEIKVTDFSKLSSQNSTPLSEDYYFSLKVDGIDENGDGSIDYKEVTGKILWFDIQNRKRSYTLTTYRSH